MIHHLKRATRQLIFWTLIATAVSLTSVRLLLSGVDHFKADLSTRISEFVGAPVTIGRLSANMRGVNPELVLKDIKLLSLPTKPTLGNPPPAIQLQEIRLGINLFDALVNSDRLASTWVTLVGAKLSVTRKQDGSIAIDGLKATEGQPLWLLQGGKYEVLQSEISWQDELSHNKAAFVGKVDLAIMNQGQRHQLNVRLKSPRNHGDEVNLIMDVQGNVFEPSAVDGDIYIATKNLNITRWLSDYTPFSIVTPPETGTAKFWAKLHQSQLVSLVGDVQLGGVKLTRPGQGVFAAKQLESQFFWALNGPRWRLDVPHFLLETADKKLPATSFSVAGSANQSGFFHELGLYVATMDLQEASQLVRFFAPLPKTADTLLAQAQLKGKLGQVSCFVDLDNKHFAVSGKFAGITVAPTETRPGVENLNGQLKGSDTQGEIIFSPQSTRLTTLGIFRDTLDIPKLKGTLAWQQTAGKWTLSSPRIELDLPDIKTVTRLNLSIPKTKGTPFMDIKTEFSAGDMGKVGKYLPVGIMAKDLVYWLDHAFVGGRIPKGFILLHGNLNEFPFKGSPGVFKAGFSVENLDLLYHPEWPHVTGMGGEVLFSKNSLQIDIQKGLSHKVKINQAKVTIADLGVSKFLGVQGLLETDILDGLAFLKKSPLDFSVDKLLDAVTPQGSTRITLDLNLPLATDVIAKVNGNAQLANARLKVKALDLWVEKINGAIKFNEQGLFSDTINAVALAQPIQISLKGSEAKTTVNVSGRASIGELRKQFDLPGWQVADGAADYQLKLQLPSAGAAPELWVQSNLAGVSLALPGSLAKTKGQQHPLALTFDLADATLLPISLTYDNQMKAALTFNINQRRIESGHILVGVGTVEKNQGPGIKLEIKRDNLALEDWLGLAASVLQDKGGATTSAMAGLREISVHSEHGLWKKNDLGFINLVLKPEGRFWSGNISGNLANGKLKIPLNVNGTDSISLLMEEMNLSALKQLESQDGKSLAKPTPVKQQLPDVMPLLTIASQKTLWQSVDLGQLDVQSARIPNGIGFNRVSLSGKDLNLNFSGDWKVTGTQSQTRTQGTLGIAQVGQLLNKLGISKNLTETSAAVDFSGGWKGAPYQFSLAEWQGKINVHLKEGRILGIEPGFGRVLGILAMAQWVKRLQLDFSDVYQEGLTFNTIDGRLDVANGKAVTQNLVIDAIPAKITLIGTTDLVKHTFDYRVSVVPKSAEAVPIAGTIMAKVAALIGRSLTGKDQEGFFFGSEYLVKGDWGNAQVIPLHENDGLLQKTWDGITDFSWLKDKKQP
ncbi:MAG: YhdP family protein [Methylococcales bacterium]|nr:YhdP family protein [Methylococcales bacterium]